MSEHHGDEIEMEQTSESASLTRRQLIKRAAIVGGVAVWGVPLVRLAINSDDGGTSTAVAAAFPDTCEDALLNAPTTVLLICAKTNSGAVTTFKSKTKTLCTPKCAESTTCATGTCRTAKMTPVVYGTVTCTETGNVNGCPSSLYARGSKEYTCTGVVTCKCACR